ncbi:MAG: KAP family NTPase, partial [Actinomycetota bacterium]|nr:KAP family NTPase [Actinomycetota bacterium]
MSHEAAPTLEWRLLADIPPRLDQFNTRPYSVALAKLALSAPLPFTIGLFGAWGEGKTTVVGDRLREALRESGGYSAAYVYFDCWKYQGDPLRRQLVAEAARQLGSAGVLSKHVVARATEEFYEARSRVERVGVAPDRVALVAGIVFAIALISLYVLLRWVGTQVFGAIATNSVLDLGGLVGAALLAIAGAIVARGTVTVQRSAVTEPEEFEKRFGGVLSGSTAGRVVVVVDNLDRTSDDKIIETLGTLKSFSEHPKLLYLVACDVDAIKRVLRRSGVHEDSGDEQWADEFLRKFFNAHVTLATHLEDDVRTYAEGLIAEAGLASTNDSPVADVILAALRRSPRRIKQLINVLVARLAVLSENDVVHQAVASIAKVVVI